MAQPYRGRSRSAGGARPKWRAACDRYIGAIPEELYPKPARDESGLYCTHFFGIRYFPEEAHERVVELDAGEKLLLVRDIQNKYDPRAVMLRTNERRPRDIHLVGFCPRYMLDDILHLWDRVPNSVRVTVERVNLPPAPVRFRLRCRLTSEWPAGFQPFAGFEHQAIPEAASNGE